MKTDKLIKQLRQLGYSEKAINEILRCYGLNSVIALSKVSGKAQITIPKDIMEILKLKQNDKILWIHEKGRIYVKKA